MIVAKKVRKITIEWVLSVFVRFLAIKYEIAKSIVLKSWAILPLDKTSNPGFNISIAPINDNIRANILLNVMASLKIKIAPIVVKIGVK